MSDTPRVDGSTFTGNSTNVGQKLVAASFARTLERENAQLRKEREEINEVLIGIQATTEFQKGHSTCLWINRLVTDLLAKPEGGK